MMRKHLLAVVLLFTVSSPALAWNNKGHMVVARLAYLKLNASQRQTIQSLLEKHPHYDEFLKADKPHNIEVDEWAFWRAATWPDWVKSHHANFSHPKWHYIDHPFVPPGSSVDADDHQPGSENAVNALQECIDKAKSAADAKDRAINLCWVLHLVGDLQQPLHCASLFSEDFHDGDRGGNAARYKIEGRIIKLHSFWDGLLGSSESVNSIRGGAHDAQVVADQHRGEVEGDLSANLTIESWATEGFGYAVKYAYLNGAPVPANEADDPSPEDIPDVHEDYATNAGVVARLAMVKGGERLAQTLDSILQ